MIRCLRSGYPIGVFKVLHPSGVLMPTRNATILQFDRNQLPSIVANVAKLSAQHSLQSPQLWELLDILPVAVLISSNRECTRIAGNVAARAMLQAPPIQNLSRSAPEGERPAFEVYGDGRLLSADDLPMQKAAKTGLPVAQSECELRFPNGQSVFLAGHSVPVFNDKDEVCGSIGAFVDITHIKRLESENQLLTKELSHRVKNTVSIIQALSHQTIRPLISPEQFKAYENRLTAIAKAHELLFEKTTGRCTLKEILKSILTPIVQGTSYNVELRGPPTLELPQSFIQSVIMIFHELGTNAIKYGALSQSDGYVEIIWHAENRGMTDIAVIEWKESGGPLVEKPIRKGFGTKMIEAAANNLIGGRVQLDYDPSGVHCVLELPTA